MSSLELKVPPLIVVSTVALLMKSGAWVAPSMTFTLPARFPVALVLVALGMAIAAAGVREFRRAQTTVDPRDPNKSTAVVTTGIYRYTRNPMYLGFALAVVAWALWLSNVLALPGAVLFVVYMNRFQIAPEERLLRARFGRPYEDYLRAVRRWI